MKFTLLILAMAFLLQTQAHAAIKSIYSITAQVNFDGTEANQLVKTLGAAGFIPRNDGFIDLSDITINGRSDSKDFSAPSDPCYQKPAYTLTFTYGDDGNVNAGKTITVNANQDCSGEENAKASAVYNALLPLGSEGDAAMGGRFGVGVTDLMCFKDIHGYLSCSVVIAKEVRLK